MAFFLTNNVSPRHFKDEEVSIFTDFDTNEFQNYYPSIKLFFIRFMFMLWLRPDYCYHLKIASEMILILVKLFLWPLSHPTDRRRPSTSLACQLHRGGHFKRKRKKYHYTFSSRKLDCSTKRPALKSTKYRQNVRIASFGLVIMFFNISSNKKPSNLHFLGPKVPFSFKSS